jgi:predicted dehydrogenase
MLNVAQIGVGYWGPNLLRNLVASKDFKVNLVVDLSSERRDFVRSLYPGVAVSDDTQDVFVDKSIDAVVIATPVAAHFELVMTALEADKHVLVEKPIAQYVSQAEQIREVAKWKGLVVMVGHTFLYNAAVRYLKQLIDVGELGQIRCIYSQRLNLGRIRSDVDALWNFAPHDISIIQYLLDNPTPLSVFKQGMDYVQNGIDDMVFMDIIYPDKVMAHIHVSWLDPHKVRRMTIVGSRKMAVYDDVAENKIAIYDKGIDRMAVLDENMDFDHPNAFTFNHRRGDILQPKIHFEEPLKVEMAHFYDCIANGVHCMTGPDHALGVVRILEAREYATV